MIALSSIQSSLPASEDRPEGRTFTGCDIVFVSLENWDEIWRRNQFLCAELARRHPNRQILFVGLARNLANSFLRKGCPAALENLPTNAPAYVNITLFQPWQILPNRFSLSRRFNEWHTRRQIRRVVAQLGLKSPVLWLNPHDAAHMAGQMDEAAVVYDITDDWSKVSQPAARQRRTIREDARLCQRADAVIVCSEALRASKAAISRHVHLVPNGVDAQHYAKKTHLSARPPEARLWRGYVYGYTGTLHGDRLDVEIVRRFAEIVGHSGSVVLIGPDHLSDAERKRLRLPNIFLVGSIPHARLPELMHCFDACIVPHKVTPFTESLNPLKLWEYLALGKAIVSTRVAGFRDYPQFVRLAEGAEEFASQVRQALSEPPHLALQRRTEAAQHSWVARCDTVENIIADCLERRAANLAQA